APWVGWRAGPERPARPRLFAAAGLDGPGRGPTTPSGPGLTSTPADLPTRPGYTVPSGRPAPDGPSASASPLAVRRTSPGTGIFTRFPSPTPLGLGLGAG